MEHESTFLHEPAKAPGVTLRLRKISFGRRSELLGKIGELTKRATFLDAGGSQADQVAAEQERRAADRVLLEWAIDSVDGLVIDGKAATVASLLDEGPEEVVQDILQTVHRQIGLTTEEIKN